MKRIFNHTHIRSFFLGSVLVSLVAGSAASVSSHNYTPESELRKEIAATPEKSGGIYYAYPVTEDNMPAIPAGYKPVFLNHYGRHGSRWAIDLTMYPELDSVFIAERNRGNLTELGERVADRVHRAGINAMGHSGELTPLGERQHHAIAKRMAKRFPTLFSADKYVDAHSSTEPRCIISMGAFLEELHDYNPDLKITRHATPGDMDFIAYSIPMAKAQGKLTANWRRQFKARQDSLTTALATASHLFKDPGKIKNLPYTMRRLHDAAIAVQNVEGLDFNLLEIFTPDDLYNLWQANNHIMYFRHGNAEGNGGHGLKSAQSLLYHLITESDSIVANGNQDPSLPSVKLHFGHDTNLIRLLALAGIDGCDGYASDPDKYDEAWQAYNVSPMGANFQMIFFKNEKGKVIVSLRHNEQPATITDLTQVSDAPGFYDWDALKKYWIDRSNKITWGEGFAVRPSKGTSSLLDRIAPGASDRILILEDEGMSNGFTITAIDGKPAIIANNSINAAAGLNWYLKYYLGIHLAWNNMKAELPEVLPLPDVAETRTTDATRRYYMNYCTHSYSMAFWDWERWEKEIDWMALHGINMPLAITGTDVVWRNTLRRLGYDDKEIDNFVAGPAFQAWWLMNNLEGWGGPNSEKWYEDRADLQRNILARMRELGMEPVLPGYSGMVPHDADTRLGVEVSGKGIWNGFTRPAFLKTTDPMFNKIADIYYDELTRLCGTSKYYSMDPFHEGGSLEGVDLAECGRIITGSMKRANKDAVWVIQGWNENPRAELLNGVDKGDIVVLDLASEIKPNWGDPDTPSPYKRPDGFAPHDWMYCMLLNFGGNVGLHGRLDCVVDGYYLARDSKYAPALDGIGITAEGIDNNPIMYELLSELIWRPEKFDVFQWVSDYTKARYGATDRNVEKGWQKLARTIYNCPKGNLQQGTTESIFCARPSLDVWQVSSWSRMKPYYNPQDVIDAAKDFAKGAKKLSANPNYRYDLVDITRQALAEKGRLTYAEMIEAIKDRDAKRFDKASEKFLSLLKAQEKLLATTPTFKVGKWIESARALGHTAQEKDLMEENARLLITTWGRRTASEEGGLRDYAHREWSGVLGDLYLTRWTRWITHLKEMMAAGIYPDINAGQDESNQADYTTTLPSSENQKAAEHIDFYEIDEEWVNSRKHYPAESEGDQVETALSVIRLL